MRTISPEIDKIVPLLLQTNIPAERKQAKITRPATGVSRLETGTLVLLMAASLAGVATCFWPLATDAQNPVFLSQHQ
jgi:hypothetical protein